MDRNELEEVMIQKAEYEQAYREGYMHVLYADEPEEVIINESPSVDYSNFSSIGYYDGFNSGEYSIRAGLRYAIQPENLIANMDKCFTQALKKHAENSKVR